jgi:hypothetical protein
MDEKKPKIIFDPEAFADFEGTQEELDELVSEIKTLFESGDFLKNSQPVDMQELQDTDPELYKVLTERLEHIDKPRLQ